ncbi:MAG: phage holin family protein [Clostridia bacterium]|nr:phage holin family protein [Clostridia bacterium]
MEENKTPNEEVIIETTAEEKPKKGLSRGGELLISVILLVVGILFVAGGVVSLFKTRGTQLLFLDAAVGRRYGYWWLYLIIGAVLALVGLVMLLHGLKRPKDAPAAKKEEAAPEAPAKQAALPASEEKSDADGENKA